MDAGPIDAEPIECPRCHAQVRVRFFGPCDACRQELVARYRGDGDAAGPAERSSFEPKMNVTPNFIATKD
jgi:hypothetical protein